MTGEEAPDFSLPSTGGGTFRLQQARGRPLVIYFYPKDNTPGCTTEAQQFRDFHEQCVRVGCTIYGISRDSVKSHEGFKAKLGLPFDLLSDADEAVCRAFDVIKTKNMYGKKVHGIERSTFVIDRDGIVRREWRGVKVPGHAQEVLECLQSL